MKHNLTDVVIVSDAKSDYLKECTESAIKSSGNDVNVIVIESNQNVEYKCTTIHPQLPFNYNAFLNIGAKIGKGEFIFFGNNDLIFGQNWHFELIQKMNENDVVSASPVCPHIAKKLGIQIDGRVHLGWDLVSHFCGWAFMWRRSFYEAIGGLDESFVFWCSDNVSVNQLKENNKHHILATSSIVEHLGSGSNTLKTLNKEQVTEYTIEELFKYNKKYNVNIFQAPHFFYGRKMIN